MPRLIVPSIGGGIKLSRTLRAGVAEGVCSGVGDGVGLGDAVGDSCAKAIDIVPIPVSAVSISRLVMTELL